MRVPEASAQAITLWFFGFNLVRRPHGDIAFSISQPKTNSAEESDGDGGILVAGKAEEDGRGVTKEFVGKAKYSVSDQVKVKELAF